MCIAHSFITFVRSAQKTPLNPPTLNSLEPFVTFVFNGLCLRALRGSVVKWV